MTIGTRLRTFFEAIALLRLPYREVLALHAIPFTSYEQSLIACKKVLVLF